MIHGPCGFANPKSSCMKKNKCTKYFLKNFVQATTIDSYGYPIYRRKNDNVSVEKGNFTFDNRFVVPYNKTLTLKYQAHINVE